MRRRTFLAIGGALLLPLPARAHDFSHMEVSKIVPAPEEWTAYHRGELLTQRGTATPTMADLAEVNTPVNASIWWGKSPEAAWGLRESHPPGWGNCVTATLEKRKALVEWGFAMSALRPCLCLAPDARGDFQGHCVLVAILPQGDFILDNLTPFIHLWHERPYIWHSRLGEDGERWEHVMSYQVQKGGR